jgi:hypothetical protein
MFLYLFVSFWRIEIHDPMVALQDDVHIRFGALEVGRVFCTCLGT